eukprot:1448901-Pleurochrysis_carterae.AAC.2
MALLSRSECDWIEYRWRPRPTRDPTFSAPHHTIVPANMDASIQSDHRFLQRLFRIALCSWHVYRDCTCCMSYWMPQRNLDTLALAANADTHRADASHCLRDGGMLSSFACRAGSMHTFEKSAADQCAWVSPVHRRSVHGTFADVKTVS